MDLDQTAADEEQERELRPLPRGTCVGRYLIADVLGQGGMGVVYRAFDPDLNRPVALKMMKVKKLPGQNTIDCGKDRSRLLREAQALAQLSHPNVVTVHDVGAFEDVVFLAMELVEGQTLDRWLRREKPAGAEILAVLMAAGRGLAAAHQVGIIHRDFKPANIIIGSDGRVRVLDFGLARAADLANAKHPVPVAEALRGAGGDETEDSESWDNSQSSVNYLSSDLTQAGAIVGTRNYMAPEQFEGRALDERTDQFAFCVVLFEAWCGFRPFQANSDRWLVRRMKAGKVTLPVDELVPAWVMKILLRGLAAKPADRYHSMGEILAALADDPTLAQQKARSLRRKRWGMVAGVLLVLGSVVLGLWYGMTQGSRLCQGAEHSLAGVWDEKTAAAVASAFEQTGRHYAQDTFARVSKVLDARAQEWVAMRIEACEATHVHGVQSEHLLDLRMRCLNRRLSETGTLVRLFADETDGDLLDNAVSVALKLRGIEQCRDEDELTAAIPPPTDPETKAQVQKLRDRLDEIEVMQMAGRMANALQKAQEVLAVARTTSYPVIVGEALFSTGSLLADTGDYDQAEKYLRESIAVSLAEKDQKTVANALLYLMNVVGTNKAEEGLALRQSIEIALGLGEDDQEFRARLADTLGVLSFRRGKYQEARKHHVQALAIWEKITSRRNPTLANTHNNLGNVYRRLGNYDQAVRHYQRALVVRETELGPEHPAVASSLNNLGIVINDQGDPERAIAIYRRALAIWEKALGPEHPNVAYALDNLGNVLYSQEKYQQAAGHYQRSLAIREKALGEEHPRTASSLFNLGLVLYSQGKYRESEQQYRQVLQIQEKTLGAQHPFVAYSRNNLGYTLSSQGKWREAQQHFQRALAIWEKRGQPHLAHSLWPKTGLAETTLAQGDYKTAAGYFEQNLLFCADQKGDPEACARSKFGLARILARSRRPELQVRAGKLARQTHEFFSKQSSVPATLYREKVESWLQKHGI